jgi:hypothetical protein
VSTTSIVVDQALREVLLASSWRTWKPGSPLPAWPVLTDISRPCDRPGKDVPADALSKSLVQPSPPALKSLLRIGLPRVVGRLNVLALPSRQVRPASSVYCQGRPGWSPWTCRVPSWVIPSLSRLSLPPVSLPPVSRTSVRPSSICRACS